MLAFPVPDIGKQSYSQACANICMATVSMK